MAVFKTREVLYFYDDDTECTYMYIVKRNQFEMIMKGGLSLNQGKLMALDHQERNLYIKTGTNELTIIFDILANPSFGQLEVQSLPGSEIVDFKILGGQQILTFSNLGYLCIFEQQGQGLELCGEEKVSLFEDEVISCGSVSDDGSIVTFGTKHKNKLARVFAYFITKDNKLKMIGQIDLGNEPFSQKTDSFFYDMAISEDADGCPVVFCFQRFADSVMVPLKLTQSGGFVFLQKPAPYHSGLLGKCEKTKSGKIWSVDAQGILKSIKIGL